ncbi:FIVAR domain-containing protein [uncultured Anaerococcus sp.]|uniref:FIVAR domain-containing protein n=1 Tax=uncultured Anaerococcus sp. TaxID=293428 RepID=UPI00288A42A7|nr:FIVAR domain-containing protein [uncultured Anaerococcus sp.]
MKKLIKKLCLSLFVANLMCLGAGNLIQKPAYAAEESDDIKYKIQREQLTLAVNDMPKVVGSEAYNTYAKSKTKLAYQQAIMDGQAILDKGNDAKIEELAGATANINSAKAGLSRDINDALTIKSLKEAVRESKITIDAVKILLETAPNKVAKVRGQLLQLIKDSEAVIREAEALL